MDSCSLSPYILEGFSDSQVPDRLQKYDKAGNQFTISIVFNNEINKLSVSCL